MKARQFLKERTAAAHDRVDALFARFDLSAPEDYRLFLEAQAEAHLATEQALDTAGAERVLMDWPRRRRGDALRDDLADLGGEVRTADRVALAGDAEMLGAIYVLEGSRLGGALLKRQLADGAPRRFLDQDQDAGAWRKLLEKLEEALYDSRRLEAAALAAERVFERFETAARRVGDMKI